MRSHVTLRVLSSKTAARLLLAFGLLFRGRLHELLALVSVCKLVVLLDVLLLLFRKRIPLLQVEASYAAVRCVGAGEVKLQKYAPKNQTGKVFIKHR